MDFSRNELKLPENHIPMLGNTVLVVCDVFKHIYGILNLLVSHPSPALTSEVDPSLALTSEVDSPYLRSHQR